MIKRRQLPALRRFPPLSHSATLICLGFPNLIIILLFFSRHPKRATANLLMRGAQAAQIASGA
jgi:hypothetical protein